jgi:PAS domain S-box-containing protein
LIDNFQDIILSINLEGKITFASQNIKEKLGYESAETINMSILDFVPEEDHQRVLESLQKGMKGEKIKGFQTQVITKSGERLFFECSFSRVYKDGAVVGAQAIIKDITESKKMEETLRQSEQRYRTILDEMADAYFEVDIAGNYTFVNDSVCHHLKYTREELIGTSFRDQIVKEELAKVYKAFGKVYITGMPERNILYELFRKDGTTGFGEMTAFPLKNKLGEVIGFRGVGRDVSERKKMEEDLRQSEERYRSILDEMADAYFEVDIAGNYTFLNDACCRHLGYAREELIGTTFRGQMAKEDIGMVYDTCA